MVEIHMAGCLGNTATSMATIGIQQKKKTFPSLRASRNKLKKRVYVPWGNLLGKHAVIGYNSLDLPPPPPSNGRSPPGLLYFL